MIKYDKNITDAIDQLKLSGWSGRAIANQLQLSKSGVNEYLNRSKKLRNGPRILVLDVETAATLAYVFGRFDINIGQNNVVNEGGWILCVSYRWLGSGMTQSLALTPAEIRKGKDSRIVKALWDLYEEADAIVAHHGKAFDNKVIQARAIANGLPPLPTVKVLDTKLLAKKYMKLPSNKLDSIGEYFGLGRKLDTGGIDLWVRVQSGDVNAMNEMLVYCEQDVNLLYEIFVKLRKLGQAGDTINAGLYYDDDVMRCGVCGSSDVETTGRTVKTSVSSFDEYRCNECGAVHRGRTSSVKPAKRKSLLTRAY